MEYLALYRKHRPKKYADVYGQDVIVKTLKNIVKNKKISNAYLLVGPRGTGKTTIARIFSKAINCIKPKEGENCCSCIVCKSDDEGNNIDIIELDAASNNGVDEIREIKEKVNTLPSISKYKIYIVDEVHMLSAGAFNALLKTLEEPPRHIIFILATTEPQKIPETIISRCQRFDLSLISKSKIIDCIKKIAREEKITITAEAISEIAALSKGGLRNAIVLLDQLNVYTNSNININNVIEITRLLSEKEIEELVSDIINGNIENILNKSNSMEERNIDYVLAMEKIVSNILQITLNQYKQGKISKQLSQINTKLNEALIQLRQSEDKKTNFEIETIKLSGTFFIEKAGDESVIKNNILSKATKKELIRAKDEWNKINEQKFEIDFERKKKGLIPVVASEEGIIFSCEDKVYFEINDIDKKKILEEMKKINKKKIFIEYIKTSEWNEKREQYLKKLKNGEIKYVERATKDLQIDEFCEIIELDKER